MITLTIDGREIQVEEGATILQAAEKMGIRIPTLCHDRRLLPVGACRICLVEVENPRPGLVPACATLVAEGLVIKTATDKVKKVRKTILELLLINHPLDCPVCDKAGECSLQDLTYEYGVSENRFSGKKAALRIDVVSPLIERNLNRCILCGKCVRICDELMDVAETGFIGRGYEARVGTDFDRPLDCEFCGQCLDICPVGALTSRLFKHRGRVWELEKVETTCAYCGLGCAFTLGVKRGKILKARGADSSSINDENLCVRGHFGWGYIHHPERLTKPLLKKEGRLVAVSWKEALHEAVRRFRQIKEKVGPDALAGIGSPRLTNEEVYLFQRFIRAGLGTNNIDHAGGYGHAGLSALKDSLGYPGTVKNLQDSDCILLLRSDLSETHPVAGIKVNLAVKRGRAALIVANPYPIKFSRHAKQSLIYRPGNEIALLNGMVRVMIEENLINREFVNTSTSGFDAMSKVAAAYTPDKVKELTGVEPAAVIEAARTYARAERPAIVISAGYAPLGEDDRLVQAAINLALITGNPEGIAYLVERNNSSGAFWMGAVPSLLPGRQPLKNKGEFEEVWGAALPGKEGMSALDIFNEQSVIRGLYLVGENPLAACPDPVRTRQVLEELELLVVQDLFLTEVAAMADIVFPAAGFAEKEGTYTNTEGRVQEIKPALTPVGEARPDLDIISELSRLMGHEMSYSSAAEVRAEIKKLVPDFEQAKAFEGKGKLVGIEQRDVVEEISKDYPLILMDGGLRFHSGSLSRYSSALTGVSPEARVEMSSLDAKSNEIEGGRQVKVRSRYGETLLQVAVNDRLPQGRVLIRRYPKSGLMNLLPQPEFKDGRYEGKICTVKVVKA
ncbi:MAG: NADH-quinone oxidoreductase subunit NuoG [bacterium]|nr:NADH-quinone oxidoreductase subunit NuoG [bacterium]